MNNISKKRLPERRSLAGRVLLWSLIALLGAALLVLLVWKWDTLGYVFNPGSIRLQPRREITSTLEQGDYHIYHREGDELSYLVLEDSIDIRLRFEGESLASLDASFNMYRIPIQTVAEATAAARLLLGPLFTEPEIEAVVLLLSSELGAYASDNAIRCTIPLAGYTLHIDGNMQYGEADISLYK